MSNYTVFDSAFKTMLVRIPKYAIPLINWIFSTDYSENERFLLLNNEQIGPDGKSVTDAMLLFVIRNLRYHLECQSEEDYSMGLRMVEYDFKDALANTEHHYGEDQLVFPYSAVIYLRHTRNTPDKLKVEIVLDSERSADYMAPIIKVKTVDIEEIFRERLFYFIPFYVMRFENSLEEIETDPEAIAALKNDLEIVINRLKATLQVSEDEFFYSYILDLTKEIAEHVLRNSPNTSKEVRRYMGGEILELRTDRIIRDAVNEERERSAANLRREVNLLLQKVASGEITPELARQMLLNEDPV